MDPSSDIRAQQFKSRLSVVAGMLLRSRETQAERAKSRTHCPTYNARLASLVGNSIACFEAQTYKNAKLIVLDDTGHFEPAAGPGWRLLVETKRYETLSAKYNRMIRLAGGADVICVWEDDDIYLPWHIEAAVTALQGGLWAHPEFAHALTTGELVKERAKGRLHASLSFRRSALEQLGGWPDTKRADFDLQLIRNAQEMFGDPTNPCDGFSPSYVFRWGSTGTMHGQSFGRRGR